MAGTFDINIDSTNNIYVAGYYYGSSYDWRIMKYDANGDLTTDWGDSDSGKIEVINAGTMSYSPILYYILIRYFITDYSPDLIVVNVDMTDSFDDWEYRRNLILDDAGNPWAVPPGSVYDRVYIETEYGVMRATWLSKITLFLYEHSHTYNFLRRAVSPSEERQARLREAAEEQAERLRREGVYTRWSWCQRQWDEHITDNASFTMNMLARSR